MLAATPSTSQSSGGGVGFLVIAVLAIAVLGYMVKRANKRRASYVQEVISAATIGSEVMTSSGMYGTVVGQDDEQVLLEIAPGVQVRFAKGAIARIVSPEDHETLAEAPVDPRDPPPGDTER